MPIKVRTNETRAEEARAAVSSMQLPHEETEANIIDLITNLLHLAHQEGLDPQAILRMAETHFEEER